MKIKDIGNKIIFQPINQFVQLGEQLNWINWNIITIEFETDIALGGYDFTFIIFGIGFHLRLNYKETELMAELREQIKSIK